mmetsp:Transcript_14704/g.34665  ORF Transcript_14704/g.34665 Transcript_14704/m.34665 type:complete len:255 (-) Transcript_14704:166-930(-)
MEKYSYRSDVDTDPSQKTIESVLFSSFFRAELRCCLVPLAPLNPHFDRQLSMLRGLEARQPVSLVDLAATFLDVGGAQVPPTMSSKSLLPVLTGAKTPREVREVVTSALGEWRMAATSVPTSKAKPSPHAAPALELLAQGRAENALSTPELAQAPWASISQRIPQSGFQSGSRAPADQATTEYVVVRANWPKGGRPPPPDKWASVDPRTNAVAGGPNTQPDKWPAGLAQAVDRAFSATAHWERVARAAQARRGG